MRRLPPPDLVRCDEARPSGQDGVDVFTVAFEVGQLLDHIDGEGLRIAESYAGPENHWFFNFRRAIHGLASRLRGARLHYDALHSWFPPRITINDADYHVASALFNMDSAIECLVFALNAVGNGKEVSKFLDLTCSKSLRRITPAIVSGDKSCSGFADYFPRFTSHWEQSESVIESVLEYHDVSKHRHAVAGSGQLRTDPPPGFFIGIPAEHQFLMTPYAETILGPDAKLPMSERRNDWKNEPQATFEQLMSNFKPFIETALECALSDMRRL